MQSSPGEVSNSEVSNNEVSKEYLEVVTSKDVTFDDRGLVPAIVQDTNTKQVLMMAWMNEESLKLTLEKGTTWFWSRSRKKLWNKGETSGNIQKVISVMVDCDCDCLLIEVEPAGPACHTGHTSCFYRNIAE